MPICWSQPEILPEKPPQRGLPGFIFCRIAGSVADGDRSEGAAATLGDLSWGEHDGLCLIVLGACRVHLLLAIALAFTLSYALRQRVRMKLRPNFRKPPITHVAVDT